jgi:hypothetical protein
VFHKWAESGVNPEAYGRRLRQNWPRSAEHRAGTDEKTNMMTELERKQNSDPVTWVGLAWRIIDIASQSNGKLLRVCALLLVVALVGVAWWWAPHVW